MKQALLLSSNVQGGGKRRVFTSSGIRCLRAPAPGEAIRGCFCRPGLAHDVSVPPKGSCTNLAPVSPKLAGDFLFLARHVHIGYRCRQSALSRLRPPWTWGGFGRPISHSRFSRVGIVTAKIAVVLILVLILVGLVLVVLILVLILVLVPLPLSGTAAADGVDPGGVRQASVIAENRPDAVQEGPAAD